MISGGAGGDTIRGGGGDDTILGGAGDDTALYAGNFADYTVTLGAGGATVSGAGGTDVLKGVEHLGFADFSVFADGTNNAPVTADDTASATEDTAVTIAASSLLANDADVDGDTLTIASVGNAVSGTVALDGNGNVVFTPSADFNGSARFDYTTSDGQGGNTTTTVTVAVAAVNDAPAAADDTAATNEDTAVTISPATLLANDGDVDGDTLSITAVGNAVGGGVAFDGNGNVVFTPAANFNGTARFDYTTDDGNGDTATATVTVAVAAVNDAPVAAEDTAATSEDTAVTILAATLLANDTDIEGDALSLTAVGNAVGGSVALDGNGDAVFTPMADFNGTASFGYTASDGTDSTAGTVTVAVAAVEDAPVVSGPVSLSMTEDGTLLITTPALLANASDGDGDALGLSGLALTGGGTLADNGNGTWTYTPPASFNGQVGLSYNVSDGTTTVATTATITVTEVNNPPTTVADTASTSEDTAVTILAATLLANDSDPEGDTLTLVSVQGAVGGSAALDAGGNVVFTPTADFNGTASFSYTVSDGTNTATQQVSVAVAAVNDVPVAGAASITTDLGVALSGALSATDVDGDTLSYSLSAGAANGTATVTAGGAYTYTPADGFFGGDSFTFAVSDGSLSSTATISVTVNPANLIAGTAGDDVLTGTNADEVLYGYAGNDSLQGAGGDDRYVYRRGDGSDTIWDENTETTTTTVWVKSGRWAGGRNSDRWIDTSHWETTTVVVKADAGNDTLSFASGIAIGDVVLRLSGSDLLVGIKGPGDDGTAFDALSDHVTITNWADSKDRIEHLRFSDGTDVDITSLSSTLEALADTGGVALGGGGGVDWIAGGAGADVLSGGAGGDVISGGAGGDTIRGGGGDDFLAGGAGDDIFVFGSSSGDDRIEDFNLAEDILQLADGVTIAGTAEQDADGNGALDTVATLSDGATVTLLGVSGLSDPDDLLV